MKFTINAKDPNSNARTGTMHTDHGDINTPIFMPVGTQGTVKGIHQQALKALKTEIMLGNTYHLYLRPGIALLEQAGGLHSFIHWAQPLLTDSGGYQVYSLAKTRHISEEGVAFHSLLDGSRHCFTPENVIDKQRSIGADIIMAFDECTPAACSHAYAKASMARTHRWLNRCIARFNTTSSRYKHQQYLFPIVQGSTYKDLRIASASTVASTDCFGNAIGGVCHPTGQLYEVTGWVCDVLPCDKPRYLMGVGTPQDIIECVALGVDMFDCVLPSRNARNGALFTSQGIINIKNRSWRDDFTPIDPVLCPTSQYYSKAYLHHLIRCGERLGAQIATLHNLAFYRWLVEQIRLHIAQGDFSIWKKHIIPLLMQKRSRA